MLSADVHVEIGMPDVHASGGLLQHAVLLWLSDRDGRQRDVVDCGSIADSHNSTVTSTFTGTYFTVDSTTISLTYKQTHIRTYDVAANV